MDAHKWLDRLHRCMWIRGYVCACARARPCACAAGCAGLYRRETRCGTHSLSMGHSHSPGREGNLAAVLNPANWRNYRPHLSHGPSISLFRPFSRPAPRRPGLSFPLAPSFPAFTPPTEPPRLPSFRHFATLSPTTVHLSFAPPRLSAFSPNFPFYPADRRCAYARIRVGATRIYEGTKRERAVRKKLARERVRVASNGLVRQRMCRARLFVASAHTRALTRTRTRLDPLPSLFLPYDRCFSLSRAPLALPTRRACSFFTTLT